jgi:hypothetical protein
MPDFNWHENEEKTLARTDALGGVIKAEQLNPSHTRISVFKDRDDFEDDQPYFAYNVQGDLGTAKKLVENAIKNTIRKNDRKDHDMAHLEEYLYYQTNEHNQKQSQQADQPSPQSNNKENLMADTTIKEGLWITDKKDNNSETLSFTTKGYNDDVFFKISFGNFEGGTIGLNILPNDPAKMSKQEKYNLYPDYTFCNDNKHFDNDLKTVKKLVQSVVHRGQDHSFYTVKEFLHEEVQKYQLDRLEHEPAPEIVLAKKAGYVQGVCECVAAVGSDYALGKKLLTEMKVTKKLAKEYASPETFKALENGIFAQKQEQKLEHQQKRGHRR